MVLAAKRRRGEAVGVSPRERGRTKMAHAAASRLGKMRKRGLGSVGLRPRLDDTTASRPGRMGDRALASVGLRPRLDDTAVSRPARLRGWHRRPPMAAAIREIRCVRKVCLVFSVERNWTCKLLVRHVADRACGGAIRRAKPWKAKMSAVTPVNLFRPRYTNGNGQPPG